MTEEAQKGGKGTVVLAFSGGLDTSICVPILKNMYGYDKVITVAADVGQPESEVKMATDKGNLIADKHYTLDLREAFVREHVFPAIKANALYEGYPMGTALARPLIASEIAKIAKQEGAKAVGHGYLICEIYTCSAHKCFFVNFCIFSYVVGNVSNVYSEYISCVSFFNRYCIVKVF